MKKITNFKKLFGVGSTCLLVCSSISAQENCFSWDYTDEAGVVVTLNGSSNADVKKLCDNIDNTTFTLSAGDYVEFELPYAMCFTGMLIYSGDETPVETSNFEVRGKKESGSYETNKTKTAATTGNKGNGKYYTLANFTTAAGAAGYKTVKLECLNQSITISEFQLFGFPNIASGNTAYPADLIRGDAGKTFTSSVAQGTSPNTNMIDGGRTTRCVFDVKPVWIECAFSEAKTVKSYLVSSSNATDNIRHIKTWTLKGSNTEGDEKEWKTIDEVTDFIFPYSNYVDMKFPVATPGSYKYYRLDVINNGGNSQTIISEFQFYDTEIYVPAGSLTGLHKEMTWNDIAVGTGKNTLILNSTSDKELPFTVYALTGSKVISGKFTSSAEVFLPTGIYILKMINSNGMEYKKKIIIL